MKYAIACKWPKDHGPEQPCMCKMGHSISHAVSSAADSAVHAVLVMPRCSLCSFPYTCIADVSNFSLHLHDTNIKSNSGRRCKDGQGHPRLPARLPGQVPPVCTSALLDHWRVLCRCCHQTLLRCNKLPARRLRVTAAVCFASILLCLPMDLELAQADIPDAVRPLRAQLGAGDIARQRTPAALSHQPARIPCR